MPAGETHLRISKKLRRVGQAPVPELVGEHGNDLFRLRLGDQGVVDNDVLAPRKAVKVCVAVRAPLGPVNDVEMLQWELESGSEALDICLELSRLERLQLVEEGENG